MANPTSNFGWQMPTPVDLVTDLPADFEVFGQAVDTSLADLKGGTSGQVLSKNSNTDMDFVWVTSDDANAIQNTIVDAKGDLIAATGADTPARLAVGENDRVLVAASGEATGLKWQGTPTAWTPSITNLTVGNGSFAASYVQIGKIVFAKLKFSFGSTSAITGGIFSTMPVSASGNTQGATVLGNLYMEDAGTQAFLGLVDYRGGNLVNLNPTTASGTYVGYSATSATVPFTWATGDYFTAQFIYEAA